MISPEDIYSFYYLNFLYDKNKITNELLLKKFLTRIKSDYLQEFQEIIVNQIKKYQTRGRVDSDLLSVKVKDTEKLSSLLKMMKKTYRSDMKRHNTNWDEAIEQLIDLEKAKNPKELFYSLDRVNNAIHNTYETVLTKLDNGYKLKKAFDTVHTVDMEKLKKLADGKFIERISNDFEDDKKTKYLKKKFGDFDYSFGESKFNKKIHSILEKIL